MGPLPEYTMQVDLLRNISTGGGYQTVMIAVDVFFSRYVFTYHKRNQSVN